MKCLRCEKDPVKNLKVHTCPDGLPGIFEESICKKDGVCLRCGETQDRIKRFKIGCMLKDKYYPHHLI